MQIVGRVLKQHQITVDDWSGGLIVPKKHMKYRKYIGILLNGGEQTGSQECSHLRMQETFILPKETVDNCYQEYKYTPV